MTPAEATTVNAATCAVCEQTVETPADPLVGELVPCGSCGVELEVVATDPVVLARAPEIEEDWGE